MRKNKNSINTPGGLVYSTDPDFKLPVNNFEEKETLPASLQQLKISIDTKHRAGKIVSLVTGFVGKTAALEEIGKKLKSYCGTGGAVKDTIIIIQGDQRDKILQYLLNNGFTLAKKR